MEKQKQIVTTVVETEQAPKAGYTPPQMFPVAKTVELIQGDGIGTYMDYTFGYRKNYN